MVPKIIIALEMLNSVSELLLPLLLLLFGDEPPWLLPVHVAGLFS